MPGIVIEQRPDRLRTKGYPSDREQLGAFAKIARALVDAAPDVKFPPEALAVLEQVEAVKAKFPKEGRKAGLRNRKK